MAKLDDVYVAAGKQGRGIQAHLAALKVELHRSICCIDTSVQFQNAHARPFYTRHGFRPLDEERLACLVEAG